MSKIMLVFYLLLSVWTPYLWASSNDIQNRNERFSSDFYYMWAHEEFIEKRYPSSADLFYQALLHQPSPSLMDSTLLYLAITQFILGDKKKSSYNASFINEKKLSQDDQRKFQRLKNNLGTFYKKQRRAREYSEILEKKTALWFTPYFGKTQYSSLSTRREASFFGIYGYAEKKNSLFTLGGEYFDLKLKDENSYRQTQLSTSLTNFFSPFSLSFRYAQIFSPKKEQTDIRVFGLGGSVFALSSLKVNLDFFFSHYPHYYLGEMTVKELTPSIDYAFDIDQNYDLWLRLGHQSIKASAKEISKGASFVKDKIYQRTFIELNFKKDRLTLGGSYWTGEEVFGVRNEGNLIFSGLEEHQGGWGGVANMELSQKTKIQLNYMRESIRIDNIKSTSSALIATLIKTI